MKILQDKLKLFTSEISSECSNQIASLKYTGDLHKFAAGLENVSDWCGWHGKTEMGRWVEILNDCDTILNMATTANENDTMTIDLDGSLEGPVTAILQFTSYLFENTFSRSIYSSMDQLIKLLDSNKIFIVVKTLRLIMVISKSSRFITQHLDSEMRKDIYNSLTALLDAWNGKLRSMSFVEFCSENFTLPPSLLTVQIRPDISPYNIDFKKSFVECTKELKSYLLGTGIELQKAEHTFLFSKIRFVYSIHKNVEDRFYQIMARLISTSIIFYSRCLLGDEASLNGLASDQYIEQCCEFLHFISKRKYQELADAVKTETLKTLASVVFLDKNKKIQLIVDLLELKFFHGFCPSLLRNAVERLTETGKLDDSCEYSIPFITSLFSLIYHIAGFEYGGDALNSSSMVTTLLTVVKTHTLPEAHISFVIRSVRIIDILTGMDVTEFNSHDGTETIVKRFMYEIDQCTNHMQNAVNENIQAICNQQRSGVMKSLLNFLKRAVLDVNLAAQMRRIMETELPVALIHIIEHPQYYGSSLLHCALMLITNFIYQEPAQLAMLQGKGLTDSIIKLIFNEKFPVSRDLVCALPNVCSALCLNEHGLNQLKSFNNQKPMERIFKTICSNRFLLSMRKRKTEILETAHMLGTSFDELVRHQPSLRKEVMGAIAAVLDDMLTFGKTNDADSKQEPVISWGVGKPVFDETSVVHIPLGDYMAMIGVILETMLTNRGNHENVQMLNEYGVPTKLVRLLATAEKPNPLLLNSNFLSSLANILSFVMRQSNKVDDSFIYLMDSCLDDLQLYPNIKNDLQERLYQVTRLSSLVSTITNFMKSIVHYQSSQDIRPLLLHHFVTNERAQIFINTLFDTYELMGSDKLLIAAQQTTTQILEDTTKVRELLRIDDELCARHHDMPMEMDFERDGPQRHQPINSLPVTAAMPSTFTSTSTDSSITGLITDITSTNNNSATSLAATTSSTTATTTTKPGNNRENTMNADAVFFDNTDVVERSIHHVSYRCHRQITELISSFGKNFCNANVLRIRQRTQQNIQLNQETLRNDYRQMSKLLFGGVKKVLEHDKTNAFATSLTQSLGLLRKLLIDDTQSTQQLLPEFHLSTCHRTFFALVDDVFQTNLTKDEFMVVIHSWLSIAQKLISSNLLNADPRQGRNGAQLNRLNVEGFELKNYLATAQKDTFSALCILFKALIKRCEEINAMKLSSFTITAISTTNSEDEPFKLLEKMLECMKFLLKDMMKLLELMEDKHDVAQEVPVNEIDPQKIHQLVEMGFSQSDAVDALLQNSSVPEAAEYLVSLMERNAAHLTNPTPVTNVRTSSNPTTSIVSDEISISTDNKQQPTGTTSESKPFAELQPLRRNELQQNVEFLCEEIVSPCLRLINRSSSVILGLSELIAVFADDPLTRSWVKNEFITRLITELNTELNPLANINAAESMDNQQIARLASMLHLFCLVWQNFPNQGIYKLLHNGNTDTISH